MLNAKLEHPNPWLVAELSELCFKTSPGYYIGNDLIYEVVIEHRSHTTILTSQTISVESTDVRSVYTRANGIFPSIVGCSEPGHVIITAYYKELVRPINLNLRKYLLYPPPIFRRPVNADLPWSTRQLSKTKLSISGYFLLRRGNITH